MRFLVSLSLALSLACAALTPRVVKQFPVGTWLENLAIRPSGDILLTLISAPEIHSLSPVTGHSSLVGTAPGVQGIGGITQLSSWGGEEVYAFGAGNVSLETARPIPGTWSLFLLHLPSQKVEKVVDVPLAGMINGLAALPHGRSVLFADPENGAIYIVDIHARTYGVWADDDDLKMSDDVPFKLGVNGLRLSPDGRWVYFTNTARALLGRFPLPSYGVPKLDIVAAAADFDGLHLDDFALREHHDGGIEAYITTNPFNTLVHVSTRGNVTDVAGGSGELTVAGCTAALFARDGRTLYVVTNGGLEIPVNGTIVEGGKFVAFTVPKTDSE
ncbi:hypothetical protein EXIGLDRAFT_753419 [Exidia glandulosa HHB12029]|uniref:SMP-30/Gluconolactonase/LRE-like region domain-containing protein n=1 Tax=Exidia glandulosa HHB12029 TaxID=1314781 RepID=A0A165DSN3_EXIGL|nr:hypothetical protein EXIGLDRAFT_753419 [Exidia glandulosa HHB12029]